MTRIPMFFNSEIAYNNIFRLHCAAFFQVSVGDGQAGKMVAVKHENCVLAVGHYGVVQLADELVNLIYLVDIIRQRVYT